jgi:hypothetical protein
MGIVKGVAIGTAGCATAEAVLVEVLDHGPICKWVIGLELY